MKGNVMCQDCTQQANRMFAQLLIAASVIVLVLSFAVVMVVNQWMR
jgi:hypothetical protein